jgi:hypothetical protein
MSGLEANVSQIFFAAREAGYGPTRKWRASQQSRVFDCGGRSGRYVLALDIAGFFQALEERFHVVEITSGG